MTIKIPDNFRPSDYGVKLSMPKPDIESKKNDNGTISLSVGYSSYCISDFAREAAREINNKIEAEPIDELLRLNGYVPERTCRPTVKPNVWGFCDFYCKCGNKLLEVANGINECLPNYCSNCGAKVMNQ